MSTELKARILDLQDENELLKKSNQELQEMLLEVATNLGVTANEDNQISFESILEASKVKTTAAEQVTE